MVPKANVAVGDSVHRFSEHLAARIAESWLRRSSVGPSGPLQVEKRPRM